MSNVDTIMAELETQYPGFAAEVEAKLARSEEIKTAWQLRPVKTLATLDSTGKAYRSRGRRSADKVSAWAVKPPQCTSDAAVLGAGHAFEFAAMFSHTENTKLCGTGHLLEAVILGMVDTLAKATDKDREQHLACIRGFAAVLEASASAWLSGLGGSDASNAAHHQTRLGHLADLQRTLRINNHESRKHRNAALTQNLIAGGAQ